MYLARELRDRGTSVLLQPREQPPIDAIEVPVRRRRGR
jgi:hypothetical protein